MDTTARGDEAETNLGFFSLCVRACERQKKGEKKHVK